MTQRLAGIIESSRMGLGSRPWSRESQESLQLRLAEHILAAWQAEQSAITINLLAACNEGLTHLQVLIFHHLDEFRTFRLAIRDARGLLEQGKYTEAMTTLQDAVAGIEGGEA